MKMDDVIKHAALRLKVHNVPGTVIHHLAILKRSLDQKGTKTVMVKGWCVIEQTKEACEHYWLREVETGLDMDLGFAVAKLRTPELAALHPVLLENLPLGLTRSDSEETLIRAENSRLFDLFQENPKAFWRESPREVTSFHMR
jgi:hypothetical protein